MDQGGEDKGEQAELGNLERVRTWKVGQAGTEGGWETPKSGEWGCAVELRVPEGVLGTCER